MPILAVGLIPPQVALFLTLCLIVLLFRRDIRQSRNITGAIWIPLLWALIIATRSITEWCDLLGIRYWSRTVTLEAGSPVDALCFYSLIGAGLYVLNLRRVQLAEFVRNNQWLTIFLVYGFLAILWSDFPFSSFKRWTKVIGHPVMALVILTEPDPEEAFKALLKRCAYVVVPLSILMIKYYPEAGRGFEEWTGAAMNNGATVNKNMLGCDCMIFGLFFFWQFLQTWKTGRGKARRNELLFVAGFGYMVWWLLSMANSSTSLGSLLLGIIVIAALGRRSINPRRIGLYIIIAALIVVIAQGVFDVYGYALSFFHRDPTLTERTFLWERLFKEDVNPVIGTGFESFWLGQRLVRLWRDLGFQATEAHNGYLETYLNLGVIGVVALICFILAAFAKSRAELLRNFEFGRFRLAFVLATVVYNWTEATFKATSFVYFVFFLVAVDYPMFQENIVDNDLLAEEEREDAEVAWT